MASPVHNVEAMGCRVSNAASWPSHRDGATITRLTVNLRLIDGVRSQWRMDGRRTLDAALHSWNATGIPLRLTRASNRETAQVEVVVLPRLPLDPREAGNAYRAGVTQLVHDATGGITSARVLIAEETPRGEPYSVSDQFATLLHELGHALGLPHVETPTALMASQSTATSLTPADIRLAREQYRVRPCPRADASVTAARER